MIIIRRKFFWQTKICTFNPHIFTMQTASKKVINGWAMYDWANSVYSLVITSSIFPEYYDTVTSGKTVHYLGRTYKEPSALYNYAVAFSFLLVALVSPLLSSIADAFGSKKRFMQV